MERKETRGRPKNPVINKNKRAVVIVSGGMDSTTLLYDIISQGYEVFPLTFNYGQRHIKEISAMMDTCSHLGVGYELVELNVLNYLAPSALTRDEEKVPEGHYADESMKQTVVPNRNMVMLSLALSYAIKVDADTVFYGAHMGDHAIYPDCRKVFVDAMCEAAKLCDYKERYIVAPYWDLNKGDILKKGLELGVDYNLTWTCYKGGFKACGKCGSCVERLEAFKQNGIEDPIDYEDYWNDKEEDKAPEEEKQEWKIGGNENEQIPE